MRLSIDEQSPFYSPLCMYAVPSLNGQSLSECTDLDTEAGWAIVFVKDSGDLVREYQDEAGEWHSIDDPDLRDKRGIVDERFKKEKLFGKVEVAFPDLTQEQVEQFLAAFPQPKSENE